MSMFQAEIGETFAACFDHLVNMIMDEASIPTTIGDEDYKTDRFVAATDDERRVALELYPEIQWYLVRRFKNYLEEERDLKLDEMLKYVDEDMKCEILLDFVIWYGTVTLRDFLTDRNDSFNPLYLSEWCDGLAVMYVQDEQLLRERILEVLLEDLFIKTGLPTTDFLKLPFDQQKEFYKNHQGLIVAIFQSIGNSLPDTEAVPAS